MPYRPQKASKSTRRKKGAVLSDIVAVNARSTTASLIDTRPKIKFTAEIKWGRDKVKLFQIGGAIRHGNELTLTGGRSRCKFKGVVFKFQSEVTAAEWMAHLTKRGVLVLPTAAANPMIVLISSADQSRSYSLGRKGMKFQVRPGRCGV